MYTWSPNCVGVEMIVNVWSAIWLFPWVHFYYKLGYTEDEVPEQQEVMNAIDMSSGVL